MIVPITTSDTSIHGHKWYVLMSPLPPTTNLATVPNSFFNEAVFDDKSDVVRFGTVVGGHTTAKSTMIQSEPNAACPHRRLQLDCKTVLGNGVPTIERRMTSYKITPNESCHVYI